MEEIPDPHKSDLAESWITWAGPSRAVSAHLRRERILDCAGGSQPSSFTHLFPIPPVSVMKSILRRFFILVLALPRILFAENEVATKGMVVISPQAFAGALEEFVAWKKTVLPTEWVALEDVLQKTQGTDDPEKLKRLLHEQ